jgi:hypothetical protein
MLGFLFSKPASYVLMAGCAVLALAAGWEKIRADDLDLKIARAGMKASEAARGVEHARADITDRIGAKSAAAQVKIEYRTRTLIREVPTYVTPATDAHFGNLPWGFVRLYNAQLSGADPLSIAPGQPDDAPSDVAPSAALGVELSNLGSCQADQQQLADLQGWVEEQRAVK